jgi:hypothetical protein
MSRLSVVAIVLLLACCVGIGDYIQTETTEVQLSAPAQGVLVETSTADIPDAATRLRSSGLRGERTRPVTPIGYCVPITAELRQTPENAASLFEVEKASGEIIFVRATGHTVPMQLTANSQCEFVPVRIRRVDPRSYAVGPWVTYDRMDNRVLLAQDTSLRATKLRATANRPTLAQASQDASVWQDAGNGVSVLIREDGSPLLAVKGRRFSHVPQLPGKFPAQLLEGLVAAGRMIEVQERVKE